LTNSGAGMKLKLGAPIRRKAPEKKFLVVPIHVFDSKSTIGCFGDTDIDALDLWALSWWSVQFNQFLLCCSSMYNKTIFVKKLFN